MAELTDAELLRALLDHYSVAEIRRERKRFHESSRTHAMPRMRRHDRRGRPRKYPRLVATIAEAADREEARGARSRRAAITSAITEARSNITAAERQRLYLLVAKRDREMIELSRLLGSPVDREIVKLLLPSFVDNWLRGAEIRFHADGTVTIRSAEGEII
jgi:hypothetical protein